MRPVALRLQAFGSFADAESVDFAALSEAGLFVVGGPTGSGKTTVFDAIAFALYGRAAGDRTTELRSHHARGDTPTEVELVFEIEGARYMVTRRPAQERARRSGKGGRTVVLPPTAELREYTAQGWVGIASRPTDVTTRCTELVGLDLHQFQRVVLLPQGDFAQFLLSGTIDRQTLLRRLFGTDLYRQASTWWIDEAKRLAASVDHTDHDIAHHLRSAVADLTAAEVVVDNLDNLDDVDDAAMVSIEAAIRDGSQAVAPRRAAMVSLRTHATEARDRATRSERDAAVFDDLQRSLAERSGLLVGRDEIEAGLHRAELALAAAPVIAAALASGTAATDAITCHQLASELHRQLCTGFDELGLESPASSTQAVAALAAHGQRLVTQGELVSRVVRARGELDDASTARAAALATMYAHEQQIETEAQLVRVAEAQCVELETVAAQVGSLSAEHERVERVVHQGRHVQSVEARVTDAQAQFDTATREFEVVRREFAAGIAPRLAQQLRDAEPCLVCGSSEHPYPAQLQPGVSSVGVDELDQASARVQHTSGELANLLGALRQARLDLPDEASGDVSIETVLDQLDRRLVETAEALALAQHSSDELEHVRATLERSRQRISDLRTDLTIAGEVVAAATERQRLAAAAVTDAERGCGDVTIETVRRAEQLVGDLSEVADLWVAAVARAASADQHEFASSNLFHEALASSPFDDEFAAAEVALPTDRIAGLQRAATAWQRSLADLDARVKTLEGMAPTERPDECRARSDAEAAQLAVDTESEVVARIERYLYDADASLTAARQASLASLDLRTRAHTAQLVAQTCAGNVAPRVALETWVLAAELERVTAQATVHLQRMSKQRYSLQRCGEVGVQANRKSGLDIEVFDAHTGRTRGPQSLSGGERFQASLALALGLADVVSQGGSGSGKVFEALFVDEGFGSLDPDALDDAIEALHHLHEHGRMVGVITHVEAMKQQLPLGFEVCHRRDGNGSTIVQPGVSPDRDREQAVGASADAAQAEANVSVGRVA